MSGVIHFFDPTPLRGVFHPPPLLGDWAYPAPLPADARMGELLDADLEASGRVLIHLQPDDESGVAQWIAIEDVVEGADGALGLRLSEELWLLFPPKERERVSNLFLKLANRHY